MIRKLFFSLLVLASILVTYCECGAALIPEASLSPYGLTRDWNAQVRKRVGDTKIIDAVLYDDMLYVTTSSSIIHAFHAETGKTAWAELIGDPRNPTLPPALHKDLLATINGSTLYIFNRYNGKKLLDLKIPGSPSAGPALSENRVYVPTHQGILLSYRLLTGSDVNQDLRIDLGRKKTLEEKRQDEEDRRESIRLDSGDRSPLRCPSAASIDLPPTVIEEDITIRMRNQRKSRFWSADVVAWVTKNNQVSVAETRNVEKYPKLDLKKRFTQVEVRSPVTTLSPNHLVRKPGEDGMFYFGTTSGYAYAYDTRTLKLAWQYSTGLPIHQSIAVLDQDAYVVSEQGGMHCVDSMKGTRKWLAQNVNYFIARSAKRVYAFDKRGSIFILDAKSGALLGRVPCGNTQTAIMNTVNDRIYLLDKTGLVQCLCEVQQDYPRFYVEMREARLQAEKTP